MKRIFWFATCVVVGVLLTSGPAAAASATFTASHTSVRPGTEIVLRSVTACTVPAGVPGPPVIRVALIRGTTVLGSGSVTTSSGAAWTARLTVDANATPGSAELTATCLANAQAEGAVVDYDHVSITVMSALPKTGSQTSLLAVLGAGLLFVGLMLGAIGARRRTSPGRLASLNEPE